MAVRISRTNIVNDHNAQMIKLPDPHIAAIKVVAVIESCTTMTQFEAAREMYRRYNILFRGSWDWIYNDEFHEALNEKYLYLKQNVDVQGKI
jgi:hypothetical protein